MCRHGTWSENGRGAVHIHAVRDSRATYSRAVLWQHKLALNGKQVDGSGVVARVKVTYYQYDDQPMVTETKTGTVA